MTESFHSQTDVKGDNNLGLYGFATDKYCLTGYLGKKTRIKKTLRVDVKETIIMGLNLVKLFVAGNSSMVLVPEILFENDLRNLKKAVGNKVKVISLETEKAMGNMALMNDSGIVISPAIKFLKSDIEKLTDLPVEISAIAKISSIGSAGLATNKGCLLHPEVNQNEAKRIESVLNVEADIGTVSFGSPYPGSGAIANSSGFIASSSTSGSELGRLAEALGFVGNKD